ncbi:hypothetical protein EYF80_016128 [Liparis tanakae]|uniref:Uncharacterized protein n=1 Tax=Liparis tanakae TaxID=230148 RepID=A0A4Z2I8U5_9TELE|nr:hypothetical protein EYF80_016128 [Liparis tanakae]
MRQPSRSSAGRRDGVSQPERTALGQRSGSVCTADSHQAPRHSKGFFVSLKPGVQPVSLHLSRRYHSTTFGRASVRSLVARCDGAVASRPAGTGTRE